MDQINRSPVAIGAIGGSGTRVFANILQSSGYYMGDDLNGAVDNLWFTLLFKDLQVLDMDSEEFGGRANIFKKVMEQNGQATDATINFLTKITNQERPYRDMEWFNLRMTSLLGAMSADKTNHLWGWKEPNTHIVAGQLLELWPEMKYIHIIRNGIHMATSQNQNQLRYWGKHVFKDEYAETKTLSLRYWCWANRRILKLREKFQDRILILKFEDLCNQPEATIVNMLNFIERTLPTETLKLLSGLVKKPDVSGRSLGVSTEQLNPDEIQTLKYFDYIR